MNPNPAATPTATRRAAPTVQLSPTKSVAKQTQREPASKTLDYDPRGFAGRAVYQLFKLSGETDTIVVQGPCSQSELLKQCQTAPTEAVLVEGSALVVASRIQGALKKATKLAPSFTALWDTSQGTLLLHRSPWMQNQLKATLQLTGITCLEHQTLGVVSEEQTKRITEALTNIEFLHQHAYYDAVWDYREVYYWQNQHAPIAKNFWEQIIEPNEWHKTGASGAKAFLKSNQIPLELPIIHAIAIVAEEHKRNSFAFELWKYAMLYQAGATEVHRDSPKDAIL